MSKHEVGQLQFDIYYHRGFQENGLCYKFDILKPDGNHTKAFCFEDVKPMPIERVIAELYADGWQMIQLTESFNLDDEGDPEIWFREAYFHRPLPTGERD
jgi:hypothetical protein